MADVEFDGFDGDLGASTGIAARSARFFGMAGAATSIALVLGLGYWGYTIAARELNGIPLVRALDGPLRMTPDDPGGVIANNQGLSVNAVAGDGGIGALADRLLLAPAAVGLSEDDASGTAVAQVAPVSGRSGDMPGLALAPMFDAPEPVPVQNVSFNTDGDTTDLANTVTASAVPLAADLDITLQSDPAPVFSLPKGALAQSIRPRARPGGAVVMASAAPASPEISGDALVAGTRLVQLGAFDSEDVARKEWERLSGKFSDLLVGKTRIVQAAQSSGRTFYRLRAMGFEDEADSRRFCSALVAERAACIPVASR